MVNERKPDEMNTEQARALLAEERRARGQKCQQELNQLLTKHRCVVRCRLTVSEDGRLVGQPEIVPLE